MRSSFSENDVVLLLKDITGLVEPLPAEVREKRIQSGVRYCEMLPLEYKPTEKYMAAYQSALEHYAGATAAAVAKLAEKLWQLHGDQLVLVSLARAGTPIGVLLHRYLRTRHQAEIPHYSISIIRGVGIDCNAVEYILARHPAEHICFVDGWIGKGAILGQLRQALQAWPNLSPELAVVSDPAGLTALCGTHEDILIPSSCLNATVTGLISRTFYRKDIIGPQDFHGAAYYGELTHADLTEEFLQAIQTQFPDEVSAAADQTAEEMLSLPASAVVQGIQQSYGVRDINFIKPGIGETTRVLLRRIPWKVLIHPDWADAQELRHIRLLAQERGVPCEISQVPLGNYKACGIIRQLADI